MAVMYYRGYHHRSRLGHSHRPWSKSDSHVKVKIKGSRQGQEIPFTQTRIKDRSEINVHWATEPVAGHGQYNVHEEHSRRLSLRSLPRVSDKVRFIQHGLSRTVSNRPVCIQSLPRRQLAQLPTKMSYYSSILSHIHIHIYNYIRVS